MIQIYQNNIKEEKMLKFSSLFLLNFREDYPDKYYK